MASQNTQSSSTSRLSMILLNFYTKPSMRVPAIASDGSVEVEADKEGDRRR